MVASIIIWIFPLFLLHQFFFCQFNFLQFVPHFSGVFSVVFPSNLPHRATKKLAWNLKNSILNFNGIFRTSIWGSHENGFCSIIGNSNLFCSTNLHFVIVYLVFFLYNSSWCSSVLMVVFLHFLKTKKYNVF